MNFNFKTIFVTYAFQNKNLWLSESVLHKWIYNMEDLPSLYITDLTFHGIIQSIYVFLYRKVRNQFGYCDCFTLLFKDITKWEVFLLAEPNSIVFLSLQNLTLTFYNHHSSFSPTPTSFQLWRLNKKWAPKILEKILKARRKNF